ncbi:Translation elongation factor 1 beta, partial [Tulasnella sp. 417]
MDVSTSEFHALVQYMDVMIPAFSPKGGYLTLQASSTMHTALENHVSILATRAMWEAYPHIRGMPSILRPASLTEMEAIGLLRGARISSERPDVNFGLLNSHELEEPGSCMGPSEFCDDVRDMLRRGWKRTPEEWYQHLEDLKVLNDHLLTRSYVEGYTPSQADVGVYTSVGSAPDASQYPHAARWYKHIASYAQEHETLPGDKEAGLKLFAAGASGAAAPAAAAADDDDIDLFGSDDEEEDPEAEAEKK